MAKSKFQQKVQASKTTGSGVVDKTPNSKTKQTKEPAAIKEFFDQYLGKKTILLVIALILVVGYLAFKDYLFINNTYWFKDIGSDEINGTYPAIVAGDNLTKEAPGSTWTFYQGMGQSVGSSTFITEPYSAMMYVVHTIGTKLWGIDFSVLGRFPLYFFFQLLFGGILAYYYMRTINFSRYASSVGAILYAFMGYSLIGSAWQHAMDPLQGLAFLFAFEQLYKKNRWYIFPVVVSFCSWNPYYLYLFSVLIFIYSIFRFLDENPWDFKGYGILLLKMLGLGIIGLGINAVNIIPSYMTIFNSPRVAGNVSYISTMGKNPLFELANFPERLTVLYRLFSNDLLGNGTEFKGWNNYLEAPAFYSGLISLLLLTQIFTFVDRRRKIVFAAYILFWTAFALVPSLRQALHLWAGNYYKGPFDVIISISLILMAAYSLSYIDKLNKINFWALIPTFLFFIIMLNANLIPSEYVNPIDNGLRAIINVFLVVYVLLLAAIHLKQYKTFVLSALLIVICLELAYLSGVTVNRRVTYTCDEMKNQAGGYKDNTIEAVQYLKSKDKTFFRIEKEYRSGTGMHGSLNDAMAQGYFGTPSYSSFNQLYYIKFLEETGSIPKGVETSTRWAPGVTNKPLLQSISNVKYYLAKEQKSFYLTNGFADSITKIKNITILKNKYYLPFGFTYNTYITSSDYQKLSQLQKEIMMLRAFVADEKTDTAQLSKLFKRISFSDTIPNFTFSLFKAFTDSLKRDTLQMTNFKHSRIAGNITVSSKKLIYFSTPYDKGWTAKVDGKPVEIKVANFGFWGIVLDKGKHSIELEYILPMKNNFLIISILFNILFYAMIGWGIWKYYKKKRNPTLTE